MSRSTTKAFAILPVVLLAACTDRTPLHSGNARASSLGDSAFVQVQTRGRLAMGVDQYSSTHSFEPLPDGGRITLVRDSVDPAGVDRIRSHMAEIASAFSRGDFSVPGFVHDRPVPGTAIMAARRSRFSYLVDSVPHGGSLRLRSSDSVAVSAIHQFLAFQRRDHRSSHAGPSH
jgi:hypothetical protein